MSDYVDPMRRLYHDLLAKNDRANDSRGRMLEVLRAARDQVDAKTTAWIDDVIAADADVDALAMPGHRAAFALKSVKDCIDALTCGGKAFDVIIGPLLVAAKPVDGEDG